MKDISGQHITILGAVISGIAVAKLAKKLGAVPFVSDLSTGIDRERLKELDELEIEYEIGGHTNKVFNCDYIITSPGVPAKSKVLSEAVEKNIKVISELEFASWFNKGTIIAITGTNGKTTTTSLCEHVLNRCGKKAKLAGNIGIAFSDIVLDIQENEFVALEVSSFQLDHIETFKPKFAVILNITPDHLDRYEDNFDYYVGSKFQIAKNQDDDDYFIFNSDDNVVSSFRKRSTGCYGISLKPLTEDGCYIDNEIIYFNHNDETVEIGSTKYITLRGEHNRYNALAVITVAKLLGIDNDSILKAVSSFTGVEHRLELVKVIRGIEFVNDSKATNVESVWYALRSFKKPIYLILGGKDKGNDYSRIRDLVKKNVKKIYAIGSSAEKVYDYFQNYAQVEKVDSLEACVNKAMEEADSGDIVLLSPACASFDMFKNYEHRGEVFKKAVESLSI
ncbi:UDP-N-acetylmuramoylalanine--D-glutamate ligase [hydrothermal vent metagenome]|uniref:UDP-N-acetylmuramoylalanine--D-glutamate ligase n=1 Tax=hydrothermal vent metagenome TaxID=652676 RepID=A0A3B1C049_9ZZZZ